MRAPYDSLAEVLAKVEPDQVQIVLPERPPAEPWVEPADAEGLLRATAILGPVAHVIHPDAVNVDITGVSSPGEAITSIVTRHPMSRRQLHQALRHWQPTEIDSALEALEESGALHPVVRLGTRFWVAASAHFPTGSGGLEPQRRGEAMQQIEQTKVSPEPCSPATRRSRKSLTGITNDEP